MNLENGIYELKFCKYCQETTIHCGTDCFQCESTSDTESEYESDSSTESDRDFIVSDSDSD